MDRACQWHTAASDSQELINRAKRRAGLPQNPLTSSTGGSDDLSIPRAIPGPNLCPQHGRVEDESGGDGSSWSSEALPSDRQDLRYVRYLDDFPAYPYNNIWTDTVTSGFSERKTYIVQTNAKIIERCVLMSTDPGDLVLDPTCGSGTTAHVAEQWGRRWITIDTSRVALALARTRLMSAKYTYYVLSDSLEGRQREAETTGSTAALISPPE